MNNTTINANPEEPCPTPYPLIRAPPLSFYRMQRVLHVVGESFDGTFLFYERFYVIVSTVVHKS